MKNFLILILFFGCASKPEAPAKKVEKTIETPRGADFRLRPMHMVTLENGLKVYFIQDQTLPRVSLQMLVKVGLTQEPKNLDGLNAITASLLEEGSQKRTAPVIADEFGQIGTEFNVSPGNDYTMFSVDSLSTDKSKVLELFGDVIMNPAFRDQEVARVRSQVKAQMQKKIDNPSSFVDDQFEKFIFGDHPYAKDIMGDQGSLKKITKSDIIKHYLNWYRPNNSVMAVVGNFSAEFEDEVSNTFKPWAQRGLKIEGSYTIPSVDGLKVKLISKPGLKQTQIRVGRPGVERKSEDFIVLRAANEILGGGMSSRLMQRVRDDLGLTYGVYSSFDFRKDKGSFVISTFTKNESVGKTLDETIKVYDTFVEKGVTERELAAAKAQMIAQFPKALETADRFAYNLLILDFYEIPLSYLTDYMKSVAHISVADVNRVIGKYLAADQLKIVIYGDQKEIGSQLQAYKPEVSQASAVGK